MIPFRPKPLNLRIWGGQQCLDRPIPEEMVYFVRPEDEANLNVFADLCHHEVTDRDLSFTLETRKQLYRRWLGSSQPTLMMLHNGQGEILVASIVLPLTKAAYKQCWFDGLDAPDIGPQHFVTRRNQRRHFLIDLLARNRDYINRLPRATREGLHGIGFRALIRHLAEFAPDEKALKTVLLCSTVEPTLRGLLTCIGFEQGKLPDTTPIYRADFSHHDWYSNDAEWLINGLLERASAYIQARQEAR